MVSLASVGAHAHDGANNWVTLSGAYTLWSNTHNNNTIRIVLPANDYYNPQSCSNVDSYMVASSLSTEARQRIYSTLLAAKLASKPVKLYVSSNACEDARPQVLNVTIT
jgi:hypothetical protein